MMRFAETGRFNDHIFLLGNPFIPIYYVEGKEKTAIIDSGVSFMGVVVANQIKEFGLSSPNLNLLTHSHYDHLGGTPFLKKMFPEMKVAGHPLVNKVLQSERAVKLIKKLNEADEERVKAKEMFGNIDFSFRPFQLDAELEEGDVIDLGGIHLEVIYTPGHTRDSVSYYIPELKALFFGEAGGVPDTGGRIQPEFSSGFSSYMNSLGKLREMDVEIIGLAHGGIIHGDDAKNYIERSISATLEFRERILNYYRELGSIEEVTERIFREDYDPSRLSQPETPFRLNLQAKVRKVVEEFENGKS